MDSKENYKKTEIKLALLPINFYAHLFAFPRCKKRELKWIEYSKSLIFSIHWRSLLFILCQNSLLHNHFFQTLLKFLHMKIPIFFKQVRVNLLKQGKINIPFMTISYSFTTALTLIRNLLDLVHHGNKGYSSQKGSVDG